MKGQLKQADRIGARATLILGDAIDVKDMDSGEQRQAGDRLLGERHHLGDRLRGDVGDRPDVLEWGEASPFAAWFDIDWRPRKQELADANGMLEDGLDDEMRAFVRDARRHDAHRDARKRLVADLVQLDERALPHDPDVEVDEDADGAER